MTLRIIAGRRRGAILAGRPGEATRPLLGRIRQSLFDILRPRLADSRVLDLFAGAGAVGLEAISQGALWTTFVEKDPEAIRIIERNIAKLRFENQCRVVKGALPEAVAFIPYPPPLSTLSRPQDPSHTPRSVSFSPPPDRNDRSHNPPQSPNRNDRPHNPSQSPNRDSHTSPMNPYDLIFIMPPFGLNLTPLTLQALSCRDDLFTPDTLFVGQLQRDESWSDVPGNVYEEVDQRVIGQTRLIFWQKR